MNTPRLFAFPVARALAWTAPLSLAGLVACNAQVVGGGSSGAGGAGGSATSTAVTTTSGGGGGVGGQGGGASSAVIYGGSTVTLRISSEALTCADPTMSPPFSTCDWFNIEIEMPAALLQVGTVVLGDHSDINLFVQDAGQPHSGTPGDCAGTGAVSGGGMGGISGTLDITDVTATSVTFTLSDSDGYFIDHVADGAYTAARCQ